MLRLFHRSSIETGQTSSRQTSGSYAEQDSLIFALWQRIGQTTTRQLTSSSLQNQSKTLTLLFFHILVWQSAGLHMWCQHLISILTICFPNIAPPAAASPLEVCQSLCREVVHSRRRQNRPHTPRPLLCSPAPTRCC